MPSTSTDRLYDTAYYHRDSRRNAPPVVVIEAQNTPAIEARREQLMKLPQGSQGQKVRGRTHGMLCSLGSQPTSRFTLQNPDVLKYDPTGLRVTMTASHGACAPSSPLPTPRHARLTVVNRRAGQGARKRAT